MKAKFTRAISRREQTVSDQYTQDGVHHSTSTRTVVDAVVDSVEFQVDQAVCQTMAKIRFQNTRDLDFAPNLTVDPVRIWQHHDQWNDFAAARREVMADLVQPLKRDAKKVNDERWRQRVMNWVCKLSAHEGPFRAFLESFLAMLEEVNLALDAHWAQKKESARNFTPEMLQGLENPAVYRQTYSKLHESDHNWGLPQEVEAVAQSLTQHCVQCREDPDCFFAFGLDEDCFAGFLASEPKFKSKAAWREMQALVRGDFSNVIQLAQTAHAVAGGWVEGPITLNQVCEHPPAHFSLWSPDARMRYWARVSTAQGELFVPVATAIERWPWLTCAVETILHHSEHNRLEQQNDKIMTNVL